MDRTRNRGRATRFRPGVTQFEDRTLLNSAPIFAPALFFPPGTQPIRPNTPVLPFGTAPGSGPSFLDPSVTIVNGAHIAVGTKSYVAPYAILDAQSGFLKVGTGSGVLDNAVVTTLPNTITVIGDSVQIGYGAKVYGSASVGVVGIGAKPTGVGPGAVIGEAAIVQPGSFVGALATVGPGVVVPPGMYVLPGAVVLSDAQASTPSLGKVVPLPASTLTALTTQLTRDTALAAGFTNLYHGSSVTGASGGILASVSGVFSGSLAPVEGTSQEPGAATSTAVTGINFEPTKPTGPKFIGPHSLSSEADVPTFRGRVIGDVRFAARLVAVQAVLGKRTSIRADQGQPISFASPPATGRNVTITSPLGGVTTSGTTTTATGTMKIGTNFRTGDDAVLLGGASPLYTVGNNVTIGTGSVVVGSNLGNNVTIGDRAYVANSTLPAGAVVTPGEVLISNVKVGTVGT